MFCEHWSSFESQIENNMILFTTSRDLNKLKKRLLTAEPCDYLPINMVNCLQRAFLQKWLCSNVNFNTFSNPPTTISRSDSVQRKHVARVSQLLEVSLPWLLVHDHTQCSVTAHSSASAVLHVCTHSTLTGRNKPPLCHFHQHEYFSSLLQC